MNSYVELFVRNARMDAMGDVRKNPLKVAIFTFARTETEHVIRHYKQVNKPKSRYKRCL